MYRPTTSPFYKPSPAKFPRLEPLSLPETDNEFVGPAHITKMMPVSAPVSVTDHSRGQPTLQETRKSTITYHNSGRESRERTVQRSSKSLIVVIPPTTFSQEHGQLGHALSSGPRSRLSQGILIPLFPTMHGQLTAIAREFNFPSTTGICLYLHFSDGGVTATPRISDDTWFLIWGSVLEAPSTAASPASTTCPRPHLPIIGRIEFDIDLAKAKWYTSWITSYSRDSRDIATSITSQAPTLSHSRAESRTTFDEHDYSLANSSIAQQPNVSVLGVQHVPKKLSLVERFEVTSVPSSSRSVGVKGLATITQEDEPQTAKLDLKKRVNSWRSSASLISTPIAVKDFMPNPLRSSPPLAPSPADNSELNIDDFGWSISSTGPGECDLNSPLLSGPYPASVHLANRMQTSVCLTPSVCTSFGPPDYELRSPLPSLSPLPSPDLGQRMIEDVPTTPSTATTWGPELTSFPSPLGPYRSLSPDLGDRSVFSRPATPSTATSWGPPISFPASPVSEHYSRSIHLADRGEWSQPITPSTAMSWDQSRPYPANSTPFHHIQTLEAARRSVNLLESNKPPIWNFAFPYYNPWKAAPRIHVWPNHRSQYTDNGVELASPSEKKLEEHLSPVSVDLHAGYPYFQIYRAVYPHFDLYPGTPYGVTAVGSDSNPVLPSTSGPSQTTIATSLRRPDTIPPAVVYPALDLYPPALEDQYDISTKLAVHYPSFDLYPSVYPYVIPYPAKTEVGLPRSIRPFNLYPAIIESHDGQNKSLSDNTTSFCLSPVPNPVSNTYLGMEDSTELKSEPVRIQAVYPTFDLYPAIYPAFNIYPPFHNASGRLEQTILKACDFTLDIIHGYRECDDDRSLSVRLCTSYPIFSLYPAIYPAFDIYPEIPQSLEARGSNSCPDYDHNPAVVLSTSSSYEHHRNAYPLFNLYPAVYPHFDLYPKVPPNMAPARQVSFEDSYTYSVSHNAKYPAFNLYPPVYPHFALYPSPSGETERFDDVSVIMPSVYPGFDLCRPVYSTSPSTNCEVTQRPEPPLCKNYCDPVQAGVPHIPSSIPLPVTSDATRQFAVTQLSSLILKSPDSPEDRLSAAARLDGRLFLTQPQELPSFSSSTANDHSLDGRQGPRLTALQLSPVEEQPPWGCHSSTQTTLIRPNSMVLPTVVEFGDCHQVQSPFETAKSPIRKRDSLVLQRVKAYNAAASTNATEVTMEVLAKFPMPPAPPVPAMPLPRAPVPSKLGQRKSPFT